MLILHTIPSITIPFNGFISGGFGFVADQERARFGLFADFSTVEPCDIGNMSEASS